MSYYQVLGFQREPFSTSPDPDFFYSSKGHEAALTNVLIEVQLRRGLSVILGDVGTGKTTLSRKLIQELNQRDNCIFHMILDPCFESDEAFLMSFSRNFGVELPYSNGRNLSVADLRDALDRFLFRKGVEEHKRIILIVDEAQKLSDVSLETLRVLLNYETNEYKLLQLVLLGQLELQEKIKGIANFFDRISYKTRLDPLGLDEMKEMIFFRMRQAGFRNHSELFLEGALRLIYECTGGYPRQVTILCHRALKELLLRNQYVASERIIHGLIEEDARTGWQRIRGPLLQKSSY